MGSCSLRDQGNEVADQYAREAASGHQRRDSIPGNLRWEASLSHLGRAAMEARTRATAQWASSRVRPEQRHRSPVGPGLRKKALRRVRKSLASRYYQLLSGHAAIGSFPHEKVAGPLRRESSERRRCSCGKRESRYHLFAECRAWALHIRRP